MMNPIDLLKQILPLIGKTPVTEYKVDIKGGWLIVALKLPEATKG